MVILERKGGAGSGHRGHRGRPGKVGGSQPDSYSYDKPRTEADEHLLSSMKMMDDMRKNNLPSDWSFKHSSYEDVVMTYGHFFKSPEVGEELPSDCTQGQAKACFENALSNSVLGLNDKYIYTEGYAATEVLPIPFEHAWITTLDGRVIDPTWEPGHGISYFGVRFDNTFARKTVLRTGFAGIIANDYYDEHRILEHGLSSEDVYD